MSEGAPGTLGGQLREYCGPFCGNPLTQKLLILAGSALFLVFIQILNSSGVDVYVLGILPRTPEGLAGLIGAPLVHGSWKHLIGNLIGWFSLGLLVLFHGRRPFGLLYAWCSLVGGFAVWVVARPVRHVGLSGVIFGFFGFLLFAAIWQRPVQMNTIIGLVVAVLIYGGTMISGVLIPNLEVSWESHVCGFVAGVVWALLYFKILLNNPRFLELVGKGPGQEQRGMELPTSTAGPGATTGPSATPTSAPGAAQAGGPWWSSLGLGSGNKDRSSTYRASSAPPHTTNGSSSAPNPTFSGGALPPPPPVPTEHSNPYSNPFQSS